MSSELTVSSPIYLPYSFLLQPARPKSNLNIPHLMETSSRQPSQFLRVAIAAIFACLLPGSLLYSQVAINTNGAAADPSAMLDVSSLSKGALLPRMNSYQRDSIASPATGLLIYNTDVNRVQLCRNSTWYNLVLTPCDPGPVLLAGPLTVQANTSMGYQCVFPAGDPIITYTVCSSPPGSSCFYDPVVKVLMVNFGTTSGEIRIIVTNSCGTFICIAYVTVTAK